MISLLLILAAVMVLLLTGAPIFAALGTAAVTLLFATEGEVGSLGELTFGKLDVYLLVAIPLFAFMAQILIKARVVDYLYNAVHALVRHWPGGLGIATVLSCTLFAAVSGSSAATALTIGAMAIPQMIRFGYSRRAA